MKTIVRAVICATVALAAEGIFAQDFQHFAAGPSQSSLSANKQAIYASISDTRGPDYSVSQTALETLSDYGDDAVMDPVEAPSLDSLNLTDGLYDVGSGMLSDCSQCAGGGCDACDDGACDDGACDDGACYACDDQGCDGCGMDVGRRKCGPLCFGCPECCGVGRHFFSVYGQFLYMRPRNADVAYAVPINGPIVPPPANNPLQVGRLGILDPDYEPAFRAGVNYALDTCSSLDGSYTWFESHTEDNSSAPTPDVLRSLVAHPSSTSAESDFVSASATLDIDFNLIDAAYRHVLVGRDAFAVNYVLGARYARLEQEFNSVFVDNSTEVVNTDIDFEGGGIRIGLETARYSCRHQLHAYANGNASFVAGRFRGNYFQGQAFDPVVVDTNWEAGRIVPILDLEIGAGWTSSGGCFRISGGYQVSAWFNTLTTQEFIRSIQGSDYVDLGQTMTFDGLTARVEYRF